MAKRDFSSAGFSKQMQATMEKSEMSGNAVTAVDIRLDKIDENPDNEKIFNMDDIERLAHAIKSEGFQGAIEVYKKEDGRYEIKSGHRRYRAMKLMGRETIPAIVSSVKNDIQRRKSLIGGNINNRDMKPMDWARVILYQRNTYYMEDAEKYNKELIQTPEGFDAYKPIDNITAKLVADFGFKDSKIRRYMRLNKLIPEVAEFVDNGYVPVTAICVLSESDEDEQREIFKMIKQEWDMISADEDGVKILPGTTTSRIINSGRMKIRNQIDRDAGLNRTKILLDRPAPQPEEIPFAKPEPISFDTVTSADEEKSPVIPEHYTAVPDVSDEPEEVISNPLRAEAIQVNTDAPDYNFSSFAGEPIDFGKPDEPMVSPTKSFKPYIDNSIDTLVMQFERAMDVEYEIKDREELKKSLDRLEMLLDKLKKEL